MSRFIGCVSGPKSFDFFSKTPSLDSAAAFVTCQDRKFNEKTPEPGGGETGSGL